LVLIAKTWATLDEFFSKYPHAWRYASGNYLGKRHGREPLTRRRRGRRAGVRTGLLLAIIPLAWAYTFHRRGTVETLTVTGVVAALAGGWYVYYLARRFRHYWTWHRPTHRALTRELEVPPARLAIERDRSKVVVGLPDDFV